MIRSPLLIRPRSTPRFAMSALVALCLVLGSMAATIAQTRMAAAGGLCGIGNPAILLDAHGLPLLDADGDAIAAPTCPACHVALALVLPQPATVQAPHLRVWPSVVPTETARPASIRLLGGQGRGPPLSI